MRSPFPSSHLIGITLKTLKEDGCVCLQNLKVHIFKCVFRGYVFNNLYTFYCINGSYPFLGYTFIALWILLLLYVLANAASQYFCASVESLSRVLRLSPAIAAVTLMSLGNGSPDVFAGIVPSHFLSRVIIGIINLCSCSRLSNLCFVRDLCFLLLVLPSHLTMRDVWGKRWCWLFAADSATFGWLMVATLLDSKGEKIKIRKGGLNVFLYASSFLCLGAIANKKTKKGWPQKKGVLSWLAGWLLMSFLWTYIRADETVKLLISLWYVFGTSPSSILGLTVISWGTSMAASGGQDGARTGISVYYAGPIFNTLAGLGSSLVVSAWNAHPMPFVIPVGPALFEILGFVMGGLVWVLVILPKRDMKLDKVLGVGLLAIYSCFLSMRLSQNLGLLDH